MSVCLFSTLPSDLTEEDREFLRGSLEEPRNFSVADLKRITGFTEGQAKYHLNTHLDMLYKTLDSVAGTTIDRGDVCTGRARRWTLIELLLLGFLREFKLSEAKETEALLWAAIAAVCEVIRVGFERDVHVCVNRLHAYADGVINEGEITYIYISDTGHRAIPLDIERYCNLPFVSIPARSFVASALKKLDAESLPSRHYRLLKDQEPTSGPCKGEPMVIEDRMEQELIKAVRSDLTKSNSVAFKHEKGSVRHLSFTLKSHVEKDQADRIAGATFLEVQMLPEGTFNIYKKVLFPRLLEGK